MSARWTAETEEMVANTIETIETIDLLTDLDRDAITSAVLIALADAGLLLPPDFRRQQQADHAHNGEPCRASRCMGPGTPITRTAYIGPWREVTEEAKP